MPSSDLRWFEGPAFPQSSRPGCRIRKSQMSEIAITHIVEIGHRPVLCRHAARGWPDTRDAPRRRASVRSCHRQGLSHRTRSRSSRRSPPPRRPARSSRRLSRHLRVPQRNARARGAQWCGVRNRTDHPTRAAAQMKRKCSLRMIRFFDEFKRMTSNQEAGGRPSRRSG
jgi:hypothetical protein